jgi:nucleoid-associated protein
VQIKNAIVHLLQKERGEDSKIKLRPDELPGGEQLETLLSSLRHLYNTTSGHGMGVFKRDQATYPFGSTLNNNSAEAWDFLEFTNQAMKTLKQRIDAAPAATGSYVFFVRYHENNNRYLIIATLKHRGGLGFDDDLNLSKTQHLDLEHLHEMARINLTVLADNAGERYLTFAKKRTDDDFSHYFREFIGCDEFSESRELTRKLLECLNKYCAENHFDEAKRSSYKEITYAYCEEKRISNQVVNLSLLSSRLDEERPTVFLEFLNTHEQEFGLADGFEPDRSVYRLLKRVKYSEKAISISFNADLWNHRVFYNKEDKTLTIRDIAGTICEQHGLA